MAKVLFHNYAKSLPIIDYHNHLSPKHIYENRTFSNITEIWLHGDHYKWRAMRACGIEEKYITGDSTDEEKFQAFASIVPMLLGNPLYHWVHMELKRYFGINLLLNEENAGVIWEEANKKLATMSPDTLLKSENVEFIGTTDDPTDSLSFHTKIQKENYTYDVVPSFRPDKGLQINNIGFEEWVSALEKRTGSSIQNYSDFLDALYSRIDYFEALGCCASDHGINEMFYEESSFLEVEEIFNMRLAGRTLTEKEVNQFKTFTLLSLARVYREKNWVMQLHIGPLRNNRTKMMERVGPDSGFDSIGDRPLAKPLSAFLNALDKNDDLPKTVLYTLNPRDNYILATMAGNFQNSEIPGKVQFGTAWWFNDHIDGMEAQMRILANVGAFKTFIGMLTDSRSLLSFSRHDYFRRILCNLLGNWSEKGLVPANKELLGEYVQDISYYNAKRYFGL